MTIHVSDPLDLSPQLQRTLAASGVGVYSYDARTRVFNVDDTCRRLFDIGAEEQLSPELMTSRIHPDDLPRYWAAAAESMRTGDFACDYRIVHRNGDVRFLSGRGHILPGPPGAPPRLQGVCIDVTTQRALEEELLAAQSLMQELADGVPGLFAYVDRNYVLRFLSAQYDECYGHDRRQHIDQPMQSVVAPEMWAKRKALYDRCLAGEVVQYEETRTMANGASHYYAVTYKPHRAQDGTVLGIMSLAVDLTGQRTAQLALEQKSGELARSNLDLEQFAYVASHDLKAPLRAIEILVDWLKEDLRDYTAGEVQQNLDLLRQRTARLHRLLDDLLAYSRAGRKPGAIGTVDSRLLVEDLIALLAPPPGLRVAADESLPSLTAHAAPLEQVLRNLINNAIKHHPTGTGDIRVYAQDKGDEVMFAVEDDGLGIPQEFAEKVFQMFQTLKPRDEVEGSGMGLAIVKRIVEWQGGRIWFHGGPGNRGTVFKFTWKKLDPQGSALNVEVSHERNGIDRTYLAG
jgi:PAS domain S-box-containing protein